MNASAVWERARRPRAAFEEYLDEQDVIRKREAKRAEETRRLVAASAQAMQEESDRKAKKEKEELERKLEAARTLARLYELLAKISATLDHRKARMSDVFSKFDCSTAAVKHAELFQGLTRAGVVLTEEDSELLSRCFDPDGIGSIGIVQFTQALKTAEQKVREDINMRHLLDTGRFLPKVAPDSNCRRYDWSPRVTSGPSEASSSLPKLANSFYQSSGGPWHVARSTRLDFGNIRDASSFRQRPLNQTHSSKKPCLRMDQLPLHEHRFRQTIATTRFGEAAPTGISNKGLLAASGTCATAHRPRDLKASQLGKKMYMDHPPAASQSEVYGILYGQDGMLAS